MVNEGTSELLALIPMVPFQLSNHEIRLFLLIDMRGIYAAPDPFKTAGIVFARILKSSHRDH